MQKSENLFEPKKEEIPYQIDIWVPGLSKPAGSKRGFFNKKTERVIIVDDCKASRPWKTDVKMFAKEVYGGAPILGPVKVIMVFYMQRPKGHRDKRGGIKHSAPTYPITRPDVLKLARACEDALTGTIYHDDSQIVIECLSKIYEDQRGPGVAITIIPLTKELISDRFLPQSAG